MSASAGSGRAVVTQFLNCLGLGGTERQLVEHLRRLDRDVFEADLLCLDASIVLNIHALPPGMNR